MKKSNFMDKPRGVKWSEKTPKEKLDFVFVCVAIVTFSLSTIIHIRTLQKK
jgi:hypothetical protein